MTLAAIIRRVLTECRSLRVQGRQASAMTKSSTTFRVHVDTDPVAAIIGLLDFQDRPASVTDDMLTNGIRRLVVNNRSFLVVKTFDGQWQCGVTRHDGKHGGDWTAPDPVAAIEAAAGRPRRRNMADLFGPFYLEG